jgi:hypothetical protein
MRCESSSFVFGSFVMRLAKRRGAVNERTVDMRALVEE